MNQRLRFVLVILALSSVMLASAGLAQNLQRHVAELRFGGEQSTSITAIAGGPADAR